MIYTYASAHEGFCPYFWGYILSHMLLIPTLTASLTSQQPLLSQFLLPCTFGELLCRAHTAVLLRILRLWHFTLTEVFHGLRKWNLTVDSGSSPHDALSIYGLKGLFITIWNFWRSQQNFQCELHTRHSFWKDVHSFFMFTVSLIRHNSNLLKPVNFSHCR